ncbi:MAG: phosphate ABC transporter substrate-binding protein PstS, partial [Armatimonadota bacterium]|nr:phosphate ABC transporter substrate-binding protein PstS [Armatimonadota bacterium]
MKEAAPGGAGGANLTGAGATFPYPIYSKWFDAYHQAKGVQINYQSIGSGGGIQQLKARTVDFGASDAPLKPDDEKTMPGPVLHIPTVAGAVVVAYNLPESPKGLKLTGETIADIFLGKIKRWNDPAIAALNAGMKLPDTSVVVAHRSDGSGTTNIFTSYLK